MDPIIRSPDVSTRSHQLVRRVVPAAPVNLAPGVGPGAAPVGRPQASSAVADEPAAGRAETQARQVDLPLAQPAQSGPTAEQLRAEALEREREAAQARMQALHEQEAEAKRKHEQSLRDVFDLAQAKGYEEGLARGESAAKVALSDQLERLTKLMLELERLRQQVLDNGEDCLIEALYIALCQILGTRAAHDSHVEEMIHSALGHLRSRDQLVIRLHPDDVVLAQSMLREGAIGGASAPPILRGDSAVQLGGCILESTSGSLDARLDTQLALLRTALLGTRSRRTTHMEAV